VQKQSSAVADTNKHTRPTVSGGLMSLLSEKKGPVQSGLNNDIRSPLIPQSVRDSSDSILVDNDGGVNYKGRRFQLYRRYAGKSVTFIEENSELKFSIEGKVLSKTFPILI